MKVKIIFIIMLAGLISSCHPDLFYLNIAENYSIDGVIMSDIDSVETTADNSLMLYGGGIAAMRTEDITQLHADFTVNIQSGEGLRFSMRTVADSYPDKPGISFDYTVNGCKVSEGNNLLTTVDSIKPLPKKPFRIHIKDEGDHYFITVDCDTVYHGITKLPATEFVIVRSLNSTKAVISAIKFEDLLKKD